MSNNQDLPLAHHHLSVDCVVFGFDGKEFKVLLKKRTIEVNGEELTDMKLPGDLIYQDEDLDDATKRVMSESAGLRRLSLIQFKAFGSKGRTAKQLDMLWLENDKKVKVERIVTIAYMALIKINPNVTTFTYNDNELIWMPVNNISELAFDHSTIIQEAFRRLRQLIENEPIHLFYLLPAKFTALQLRTLFEKIYNKELDVRNFQKKLAQMKYVAKLDEREKNVAHRAASYYRFDKVAYNKSRR